MRPSKPFFSTSRCSEERRPSASSRACSRLSTAAAIALAGPPPPTPAPGRSLGTVGTSGTSMPNASNFSLSSPAPSATASPRPSLRHHSRDSQSAPVSLTRRSIPVARSFSICASASASGAHACASSLALPSNAGASAFPDHTQRAAATPPTPRASPGGPGTRAGSARRGSRRGCRRRRVPSCTAASRRRRRRRPSSSATPPPARRRSRIRRARSRGQCATARRRDFRFQAESARVLEPAGGGRQVATARAGRATVAVALGARRSDDREARDRDARVGVALARRRVGVRRRRAPPLAPVAMKVDAQSASSAPPGQRAIEAHAASPSAPAADDDAVTATVVTLCGAAGDTQTRRRRRCLRHPRPSRPRCRPLRRRRAGVRLAAAGRQPRQLRAGGHRVGGARAAGGGEARATAGAPREPLTARVASGAAAGAEASARTKTTCTSTEPTTYATPWRIRSTSGSRAHRRARGRSGRRRRGRPCR